MALEAQNNPFTSVLIVEAADVEALPDADPSAGQQRLAVGTDHLLYLVNSSGVKTAVGGAGGAMATDVLWDAAGDLAQGTGANTGAKLTAGTAGYVLTSNGAAAAVSWQAPVLSYSENRLTGDVSIATAGTFADGPSLTLGAGTWMMDGYIECTIAAGGWINVRLLEGSTVRAASETFQNTGTAGSTIPISAVVVLSGSTTVKIQATVSSPTTGTIKATPATNNTNETNLGSYLRAVRIA